MSSHQCIGSSQQNSLYTQGVQSFSQYLHKKGWNISHLAFASIFAEPKQTVSNAMSHSSDWQTAWKAEGFHDVSTPAGYQQLEEALKTSSYAVPTLFFHGVYSSPAVWTPWVSELSKAQKEKKIGPVITLQLPNNTEEEVELVRKTISRIAEIYSRVYPQQQTLMDLVGHSKGGYVAHIASFKSEHIHDEQKIERRWHSNERNPLVRKVITITAPTWLCEEGAKDGNNIYPEKGFTAQQIANLEDTHKHIIDLVGLEDAISPTTSPLSKEQVYEIQHGHLSILCPEVCKLVIDLLNKE